MKTKYCSCIRFYLDLIPQQHCCHSNNLLRNNNKNEEINKQTNHLNKFRLYRLNGNLSKSELDRVYMLPPAYPIRDRKDASLQPLKKSPELYLIGPH